MTTRHIRLHTAAPMPPFNSGCNKLALHKILLAGAFVRANIYNYKLYLLHSHARNSLINYKKKYYNNYLLISTMI